MNSLAPSFTIQASCGAARCGTLHTPHGTIPTPAFVFCATMGVLRGLPAALVNRQDCPIQLASTAHLLFRPGGQRLAEAGGLQRFSGWHGPMLTDSGGFQIYSLGAGSRSGRPLVRLNEAGAEIRSPWDGSPLMLGPEQSIHGQRAIGADLCVTLDECPPLQEERDPVRLAMERTHRWAERSVAAFEEAGAFAPGCGSAGPQGLYGVIQGGIFADLREASARFIRALPVFGLAIGGILGARAPIMRQAIQASLAPLQDDSRPRHLLGIGSIGNVFDGVACGVDTFDCVTPTRLARHGSALVRHAPGFRLNLSNASHADDPQPLEPDCPCLTCQTHNRAWLHHLFRIRDIAGPVLLTLHNMSFMARLFAEIRQAITAGDLDRLREAWLGPGPPAPDPRKPAHSG